MWVEKLKLDFMIKILNLFNNQMVKTYIEKGIINGIYNRFY